MSGVLVVAIETVAMENGMEDRGEDVIPILMFDRAIGKLNE